MIKKHEQGKCPICGSTRLDYGVFEYHGDEGYYPVKCLNCHIEFKENYSMVDISQ